MNLINVESGKSAVITCIDMRGEMLKMQGPIKRWEV